MEQGLNDEIRDKLTKVCICKGISRKIIKDAIKNGAKTIKEVQEATGAGSGACGGRRCTAKIQQLLKEGN
ncbi:MAG TPA: (2Fe-2S)-binding protein [Epulopiscium sp.]|nr:(2Fe-2S)-binding protein [Candidatus Epulonipiscium sp.]